MTKLEQLQRTLREMGADDKTVEFVKYVPVRMRHGSTIMQMQIDMPKSLAAARDRIDMLRNGTRIDRSISQRDAREIRSRMHAGRIEAARHRKRRKLLGLLDIDIDRYTLAG